MAKGIFLLYYFISILLGSIVDSYGQAYPIRKVSFNSLWILNGNSSEYIAPKVKCKRISFDSTFVTVPFDTLIKIPVNLIDTLLNRSNNYEMELKLYNEGERNRPKPNSILYRGLILMYDSRRNVTFEGNEYLIIGFFCSKKREYYNPDDNYMLFYVPGIGSILAIDHVVSPDFASFNWSRYILNNTYRKRKRTISDGLIMFLTKQAEDLAVPR